MDVENGPLNAVRGSAGKKTGGEMLTQSALAYIESHYKERFSLQAMAGELFVNGSYLTRVFRQYTGMTPLAYHHRLRCKKAKELLAGSTLTISQVGEAVGYVSSSHFAHIFRKLEGCTPGEFRKNHKSAADERTDG